jgi:hypothetical protein
LLRCLGAIWVTLRTLLILLLLGLFRLVLGLPLQVVLGQVAALAHTVRVVGLVRVAARRCHLRLTLILVAAVAHILRVGLLVRVRACHHHAALAAARILGDTALSDLQLRQQQIVGKLGTLVFIHYGGWLIGLERLHLLILLHLVGQLLDFCLEQPHCGVMGRLLLGLLIKQEHSLHGEGAITWFNR